MTNKEYWELRFNLLESPTKTEELWRIHKNQLDCSRGIHTIKKIREYRNKSGFHRYAVYDFLSRFIFSKDDFKEMPFHYIYKHLEEIRNKQTLKRKQSKPKWINQ